MRIIPFLQSVALAFVVALASSACGVPRSAEPESAERAPGTTTRYRAYTDGKRSTDYVEESTVTRTSTGWEVSTRRLTDEQVVGHGTLVVDETWSPVMGAWWGALAPGGGTTWLIVADPFAGVVDLVFSMPKGDELWRSRPGTNLYMDSRVEAAGSAVCHLAGAEPQARTAFPGNDYAIGVRRPTGLMSGGMAVDFVAMDARGPDTEAGDGHWCRGKELIVMRYWPRWVVAEGAEDLARELGAKIPHATGALAIDAAGQLALEVMHATE